MPILVDGHNLIPKIPGLHLSDIDDEMRLLEMLQAYSRQRRRGVIECYFDNAPQGDWPRAQRFGQVRAQFARRGSSADDEIESRLKSLGSQARNWIVVSSDWRVRRAARAAGARDRSADDFAAELVETLQHGEGPGNTPTEKPAVSDDELAFWLSQFQKPHKKDGS